LGQQTPHQVEAENAIAVAKTDTIRKLKDVQGAHLRSRIQEVFPKGSYVRVKLPDAAFKKGAEPKFSQELYKVVDYLGYSVVISPHNRFLKTQDMPADTNGDTNQPQQPQQTRLYHELVGVKNAEAVLKQNTVPSVSKKLSETPTRSELTTREELTTLRKKSVRICLQT
jgi:hypothetical protein